MSWTTTFEYWIAQGKTKAWLVSRLNVLYQNYPHQFEQGEYEEILALINAAYPDPV
jgi:hypothetical protein